MDDKDLRAAIEQALDWEPIIDAKGIGVAVQDGVVTLSGHVPTYAEKREAEKVAGAVRGVKAVACELEVELPASLARSDEEIARAASNAIAWNALLPQDAIQVWVDKGRVTLEGVVDWQHQRKAAGKCIRYLAGVRDVNNHVVVRPRVDRTAARAEIEAALFRNAHLDAHHIHVDVRGDRVTLFGTVPSWLEREAAEQAAWGALGVSDVENLLVVSPVTSLVAP